MNRMKSLAINKRNLPKELQTLYRYLTWEIGNIYFDESGNLRYKLKRCIDRRKLKEELRSRFCNTYKSSESAFNTILADLSELTESTYKLNNSSICKVILSIEKEYIS